MLVDITGKKYTSPPFVRFYRESVEVARNIFSDVFVFDIFCPIYEKLVYVQADYVGKCEKH